MITSTSNDRIKNLSKLIKQAKERRKQDVFVVEGIRMFVEIPKELHVETFATQKFYDNNKHLFDGLSFELVADHIMESVSDTKTPQGVISIVKRLHYDVDFVCGTKLEEKSSDGKNYAQTIGVDYPLLMALENIQDPGNMGTILRTAEGAGVTGILMSADTVDVYNPKVVRSTMGSLFRIPFCYVEDLTACIKGLNEKGYQTYSAHLQGKDFYDYDYKEPSVFCIGNEGNGLTDVLSSATTHKIKIPMMGKVESLNAATASTVLMYEAMRQRRN